MEKEDLQKQITSNEAARNEACTRIDALIGRIQEALSEAPLPGAGSQEDRACRFSAAEIQAREGGPGQKDERGILEYPGDHRSGDQGCHLPHALRR